MFEELGLVNSSQFLEAADHAEQAKDGTPSESMVGELGWIQRAELLKQECHTGKVVSNIHRLGPKNTHKNCKSIEKQYPQGAPRSAAPCGAPPKGAPYCFSTHLQFLSLFWAQPAYVADYFPV